MAEVRTDPEPRLFTPDAAAAYLSLGSRWSVYRLVAAGVLPAVKIAGKLRIDRADLDALIESAKGTVSTVPPLARAQARRPLVRVLAPLVPRRKGLNGDSPVTPSTQQRSAAGRPQGASALQSVAPHLRPAP